MFAGVFEITGWPLSWFYGLTSSYSAAIALIAALVMLLVTPLNLKSTKGMLEMQRLAPEMRRLQNEHRNDRQKLNEEMMELYKAHKVNPMSSCLPLVAQMPVFLIMYRILTGMTYRPSGGNQLLAETVLAAGGDTRPIGFLPRHLAQDSELYQSLVRGDRMTSFGLDLSRSPAEMLGDNFGRGLIYAGLVAVLGLLYLAQQKMVAARAAVSPTMSPAQQKLMQYLPVVFAVFQIFFLLGLVVYYIVQTVLRIAQQAYITKRFYSGEHSLGRQAQAAGERARQLAKEQGDDPGPFGGLAGRGALKPKEPKSGGGSGAAAGPRPNKRTTPPKNRPTSVAKRPGGRPGGGRPTNRPPSRDQRKRD